MSMPRRNPLMDAAASERHTDCCLDNFCAVCGSHVSSYNADEPLLRERPHAEGDYYVACDNADCEHAYGEGMSMDEPEWIVMGPPAADRLFRLKRSSDPDRLDIVVPE